MSDHKQDPDKTQIALSSDTTRIQSLDAVSPMSSAPVPMRSPEPAKLLAVAPLNPLRLAGTSLEKLAGPLLMVIAELRRPQKNIDLTKLRQGLTLEINSFDVKARSAGFPDNKILLARYLLCAVIDEFVLDTPWGVNSNWSEYSMLNTFHQDSAGGQKFFVIIDKLILDPVNYIEVLEIAYICLQLGFLGKYRIMQGGLNQLATIKQNIYQQIRNQRGAPERGYATVVQPLMADKIPPVKRVAPLKLATITAAILAVIFVIYFAILFVKASGVQKELRGIIIDNSAMEHAGTRQAGPKS